MKIGVWNTAFLGDAVLTLPLLRVLRAAWPEAELDFYVRGGLAPLFVGQPELNHVYAYDKRGTARGLSGFWLLGREVAARRYDLWIDAHLSLRSSVMARLSGARRRVGYAEASLGWWMLTDTVGRKFQERQEVERLLALLKPLNLPPDLLEDEKLLWPQLTLPLRAQGEADKLLDSLPPGPILGVNPGSVWPTKRWLPEGFAAVMARALKAGAHVVLLAAPDEMETAREVLAALEAAQIRENAERDAPGEGGAKTVDGRNVTGEASNIAPNEAVDDGADEAFQEDVGITSEGRMPAPERTRRPGRLLDLSGKTSLPVLAAVISRLQCYLTNDSGPMHLAWAQRTPVTALFGPTVRELGFFPRGDSTVIETGEPCRPCGLHGHKECPQKHFRCMKGIDPDMVWRDVYAKLYPWKQDSVTEPGEL